MTMRVAIVASLLLAATAGAYESKCFREGAVAECDAGPDSARGHWIAPAATDEHRQIWEQTRVLAGLPAEASGPFTLRIFTRANDVAVGGNQVPSLIPVDFSDALRVLDRPGSRTVGEFAQLPDFSFSLWDWVRGHETCPLDPDNAQTTSPTDCHDFRTHMGPVNSSHFPPQAQVFYDHYHGLAMQRARDCNGLENRLGADRARFHEYLLDCEREALILEAVSHHFLQDAWSMGHMWERWGSPGIAAFNANRKGAIAVGMFSGLIHGARGVVQGLVPEWANFDVDDALCAPHPFVEWRRPNDLTRTVAIGDDYLPSLTAAGEFRDQYREMYSCTVSSLRDVYDLLASPELGPANAIDPGLRRVMPLAECFTQRATNVALDQGAGLDLIDTTGQQLRVDLDEKLLSQAIPMISNALAPPPCGLNQLADPACAQLVAQFRMDTMAVVGRINAWRALDPFGIQAASGSMPTLMNFGVNGAYANQPLPAYVDPQLPWPSVQQADPHAFDLALAFHRAHAGDWCAALNGFYLDGLKRHLLDATKRNATDEIAAAKEACTEIASRHTRTYTAGGKRPDGEPLCTFAASDPSRVAYLDRLAPTGTNQAAAASWCTCGNGNLDAGEECDPTADAGDFACPGHCLAPRHLRPVGSTCVLDECTCAAGDDTPSCGGILYVRQPDCEISCGPGGDIWLMDEHGGNPTNLTNTPTAVFMGYPKWSPDRRRMAYTYVQPDDPQNKIHVVVYNVAQRQSEGEVAVIETALDPRTFKSSPTWSPDGGKIAVEAHYGVHTIDLAHGNFMTWLPNPVYDRAPDWSPDGTQMAILDGAVKIIPATGGAAQPLSPAYGGGYGPPFGNPRWAPDGSQLVFTSSSGSRIAIVDVGAGGTATLLDPLAVGNAYTKYYQDATWSPDGTRILFSYVTYDQALPSGIQRSVDLWAMDADGTNPVQLTATEAKPDDAFNISEIGGDW